MNPSLAAKAAKEKTTEQGYGRVDTHGQGFASRDVYGDVLDLQRSAGNRAVGQILKSGATRPGAIQGKLTISQPGDKYEQEADRVADQVMRMPDSQGQHQTKPAEKTGDIGTVQSSHGQLLDPATRDFMESRFGHSFGDVRIHTHTQAAAAARVLGARSYTIGRNIFFSQGQYMPGTLAGRKLLAHELTHVCQQSPVRHDSGGFGISTAPTPVIQRSAVRAQYQHASEAVKVAYTLILNANLNRTRFYQEVGKLSGPDLDDLEKLLELFLRDDDPQSFTARAALSEISRIRSAKARTEPRSTRSPGVKAPSRSVSVKQHQPVQDAELRALRKERNELQILAGELLSDFYKAKSEDKDVFREQLSGVQAQIDKINQRLLRSEQQRKRRAEMQRGLAQIKSDAQHQAVDMSDIEIDIQIRQLEQEKSIETNPKRVQVIDAIIEGLKLAKVEDRKRRGPETTDASRRERMSTLEESSREDAAHLVRRMDRADLTRLATIERDRIGKLGLELAEATTGQTLLGVGAAGIPVAGSFLALPSEIVSNRFEEKKAVERLAEAAVHAGGPTEVISVPDRDQLTNLKIERSGDKVTFEKTDVLHGLGHMNVTSMGTRETPQKFWEFAPSDLVTLSVPGEGEMTLPAYAWLHREDVGLQATFQEWASLVSEGATGTFASVKTTGKALGSRPSVLGPTSRAPVRSPKKVPAPAGGGVPKGGAVPPTKGKVASVPPRRLALPPAEPPSVRPRALDPAERAFAEEISEFRGGKVIGPRLEQRPTADISLGGKAGAAVDLKRIQPTTVANKMHRPVRNAAQKAARARQYPGGVGKLRKVEVVGPFEVHLRAPHLTRDELLRSDFRKNIAKLVANPNKDVRDGMAHIDAIEVHLFDGVVRLVKGSKGWAF